MGVATADAVVSTGPRVATADAGGATTIDVSKTVLTIAESGFTTLVTSTQASPSLVATTGRGG